MKVILPYLVLLIMGLCPGTLLTRDMKSVNTALIIGAIAVLFLVWNFKAIFGSEQMLKSKKMKAEKTTKSFDDEEAVSMQEAQTAMILGEILSLNRAAHVLTRSGSILDKLLKMDNKAACEQLVRDYELSSVMVLVKRDHHEEVEEGFKKIENIKTVKTGLEEEKTVKVNTSDNEEHEDQHHHTTNDPLRIALYCKNVGRVPRVGRVIRGVESEADHDEKYIIELIK